MILNFGSINVDHVYRVPHLPTPGETITSSSYRTFLGGKATGPDGSWAREQLRAAGISTNAVLSVAEPTGHAVIAVDDAGENQITIFPGANRCLTLDQINQQLDIAMAETSWVLIQNETNYVDHIAELARNRDLRVAYSAAPFVAEDALVVLDNIDLLVVNEIEHRALCDARGNDTNPLTCDTLITRGSEGAELIYNGHSIRQPAIKVQPVDTTGAGDTFIGSFLGRLDFGESNAEALRYAAQASAIQVTREGTSNAIPHNDEVLSALA